MDVTAKILRRKIEQRLDAANVNRLSYLATDYLNHFNEVVMLFWMVPDMPEVFKDIEEWHPQSYIEYFQKSDFQMKEMVIWAYELSPPEFREPFDALVLRIDRLIIETTDQLRAHLDAGLDGPALTAAVSELTSAVNDQLESISNLINAAHHQHNVDDQFTGDDVITLDQKGIDLFFPNDSSEDFLAVQPGSSKN